MLVYPLVLRLDLIFRIIPLKWYIASFTHIAITLHHFGKGIYFAILSLSIY